MAKQQQQAVDEPDRDTQEASGEQQQAVDEAEWSTDNEALGKSSSRRQQR